MSVYNGELQWLWQRHQTAEPPVGEEEAEPSAFPGQTFPQGCALPLRQTTCHRAQIPQTQQAAAAVCHTALPGPSEPQLQAQRHRVQGETSRRKKSRQVVCGEKAPKGAPACSSRAQSRQHQTGQHQQSRPRQEQEGETSLGVPGPSQPWIPDPGTDRGASRPGQPDRQQLRPVRLPVRAAVGRAETGTGS